LPLLALLKIWGPPKNSLADLGHPPLLSGFFPTPSRWALGLAFSPRPLQKVPPRGLLSHHPPVGPLVKGGRPSNFELPEIPFLEIKHGLGSKQLGGKRSFKAGPTFFSMPPPFRFSEKVRPDRTWGALSRPTAPFQSAGFFSKSGAGQMTGAPGVGLGFPCPIWAKLVQAKNGPPPPPGETDLLEGFGVREFCPLPKSSWKKSMLEGGGPTQGWAPSFFRGGGVLRIFFRPSKIHEFPGFERSVGFWWFFEIFDL